MLLRFSHETRFNYSEPVFETVFEVRMNPQSDEDQTVLGYRLRTSPRGPLTSYQDGFDNRVDLFNLRGPYRELIIQSRGFVRTHRRLGAAALAGVRWPGAGDLMIEALEFLTPSRLIGHTEALRDFVGSLPKPSGTLADVTRMIMDSVSSTITYEKKVTRAETKVEEALELKQGVCQDFAHLFIGTCRLLGLPARYVSGYIHQPGELATHAWCQVWSGPLYGWVDVDPTHGVYPEDDHIVTAVGCDYADVPPNRGLYRGQAAETIAVSVQVEPIDRVPHHWQEWVAPMSGVAPGTTAPAESPSANALEIAHHPETPDALRQQQGQQQQVLGSLVSNLKERLEQ